MRAIIPMVIFMLTTASTAAFALTGPTQQNMAFGPSVPKDPSGQTLLETSGPTRTSGGEHFVIYFAAPKTITDIKITDFSTGKDGKQLIHLVTAYNQATATPLNGLYTFASAATVGNPTNYNGLVMLADNAFVEVTPNQVFTSLDLQIEAFTDNDASLLLQISSSDGLPTTDFLVTRSGAASSEVLGSYVNEANYAKFALSDLQTVMNIARQPAAGDLAGKNYVCTSYTKLNPTQVDFKTRSYALNNGALQSSSPQEGENLTWNMASEGLELPLANYNGCGQYMTYNVVRETAAGNLISEVELNLNAYLALCTSAGYDPAGTQDVETNSTFASIVNPSVYVVDSYEFCHVK